MTQATNPQPGDCLLYNTKWSLVDAVIRVKTWSIAAHCECFIGNGQSVASRNGIGVNQYDCRSDGLVAVLRPAQRFDLAKALSWFKSNAKGQGYDFIGLMSFYLAVKQGSPNKMFCSEFLTRFYRAGGFDSVNPKWDADKVAPGTFLMSPAFNYISIT